MTSDSRPTSAMWAVNSSTNHAMPANDIPYCFTERHNIIAVCVWRKHNSRKWPKRFDFQPSGSRQVPGTIRRQRLEVRAKANDDSNKCANWTCATGHGDSVSETGRVGVGAKGAQMIVAYLVHRGNLERSSS